MTSQIRDGRWGWMSIVMLAAATAGLGCASLPGPVKGVLTPLTVVRDVVDVPLASVANGFEYFADQTRPAKAPGAGVGWSWKGGFNWGIGYDLSHFLWKGLSWVFGGVDYPICRSFYPQWPKGISPWIPEGGQWSELYWPNTRALWREPAAADGAEKTD